MKKAINLESERLIYKALSLNHCTQEYVDWMNDDDVVKYLQSGGDYTFKKLENFLIEQEQKNILFWAIHLKESKKHIGNIKIDPIDHNKKSGEYGILMGDKKKWGKGFGKEASRRILKYCFEDLKFNEITLGVKKDNNKAVKFYKKMGFTIDEVKKDVGIYNSKLSNSLRMSLNVKNFK